MPKLADRVKETTTTSGTGTITLAGAATGFQAFSSGFTVGDKVWYCIVDGTSWEVGIGTLASSNTLSRDTVTASSASGAKITLSGSAADVFCTISAKMAGAGYLGAQTFTASGTYSKGTNNPTFIVVEVIGGGGAGGAGGTSYAGCGGGAGGYSRKKILASALGTGETVTVGGSAQSSSFGAHCSATPGSVGAAGTSGAQYGGAGGIGTGGDVNLAGGDGMSTMAGYFQANGGNSVLGGGGGSSAPGVANTGGGGGGQYKVQVRTSRDGGTGIVIVHEYA